MSEPLGQLAARQDLRVRQGATFGPITATAKNPDGTALDLTGCSLSARIRKTAKDLDLAATIETEIIDAAGGIFEFGMNPATTATLGAGDNLNAQESKYSYDLDLTDSQGRIIPLLEGVCKVYRNV